MIFVHGNNLEQKEKSSAKYSDSVSVQYLKEIRVKYDIWKNGNEKLYGPSKDMGTSDYNIIKERVRLLNEYKDFIDQQHYAEHFDSRSNLHSSVLEEFLFYLFRDLVQSISDSALIGKSHSFKDIFFKSNSFLDMLKAPHALIEKKDHDFAIGISINSKMTCADSKIIEEHTWDIPAVAIECKTYLDKTMLQDVSTAAEQLKTKNPDAMYIVIAEWLKLTESINLKKFKIDQIYVLRKQKNTDREFRYLDGYTKNPIFDDVVFHCFSNIRKFLTENWDTTISDGLGRGFLI